VMYLRKASLTAALSLQGLPVLPAGWFAAPVAAASEKVPRPCGSFSFSKYLFLKQIKGQQYKGKRKDCVLIHSYDAFPYGGPDHIRLLYKDCI
jgi:hypothetical protein